MYQKKKKRKKIIIVFCAIFISFFLLFYSLSSNRKIGVIEGFFKDGAVTISKIVMTPFTTLNKEKDKDASKSYLIQKNINVHLEEEIEQLRDTLALNQTLTGYEIVNATVVNRNKSYWYQTLTIDKGKANGWIGKLEKVTNKSATVKLITANDVNNKVSVAITTSNGETNAILSGYDKKKNEILVSGVDSNIDIKKDDSVTTSGLGGMFPRGIYIGKVESISTDKYGLSKTLAIKTNQNFNSIHYVTVLKGDK